MLWGKMILGIDLDDMVYDFIQAWKDYYCKDNGIDPDSLKESRRWNFFEDWGIPMWEYKETLAKGVRNGEIFWKGNVMSGSVESLRRLDEKHYIIIVTHRNLLGLENACEKATKHWLAENNVPYDGLILTDQKTGLGLDVLFDDAIHNVRAALACGEKAVLMDRPGNEDVDFPRVKEWSEFEEYVEYLDHQIKAPGEILSRYS